LETLSVTHPLQVYPNSIHTLEFSRILEIEGKRMLDLSEGAVLAASLYSVEGGSYLLAITLHHAAAGKYLSFTGTDSSII